MSIFDWPDDKPAHEAIGEAIGAASMCWIPRPSSAVFDSTTAGQIAQELEDFLKRKLWVEPQTDWPRFAQEWLDGREKP